MRPIKDEVAVNTEGRNWDKLRLHSHSLMVEEREQGQSRGTVTYSYSRRDAKSCEDVLVLVYCSKAIN